MILEERYYLETAKKAGKRLIEITQNMEPSQSTISRELKRNTWEKGCQHKQAMRLGHQRINEKPKKAKSTQPFKD